MPLCGAWGVQRVGEEESSLLDYNSNYRTAAEEMHVAAATRRRRRILQTGFFFTDAEKQNRLKLKPFFDRNVLRLESSGKAP